MAPSSPVPVPDAEILLDLAVPERVEAAFHTLYRRHAPRVLAYLRARMPANDVHDTHQEVWTRAWEKLPRQAAAMTNFRAWLFTVAEHCRIDQLRRRRLPLGEEVDVVDTQTPAPLDVLLDGERRDRMRRCLEGLDSVSHAVIVRSCEAVSADALAAELSLSVEALYQRKSRALKALRACLERELP